MLDTQRESVTLLSSISERLTEENGFQAQNRPVSTSGENSEGFGDVSLAIWIAVGLTLGTSLGATIGVVVDNIAVGVGLGSAVGLGLGAALGVTFGATFDDE